MSREYIDTFIRKLGKISDKLVGEEGTYKIVRKISPSIGLKYQIMKKMIKSM